MFRIGTKVPTPAPMRSPEQICAEVLGPLMLHQPLSIGMVDAIIDFRHPYGKNRSIEALIQLGTLVVALQDSIRNRSRARVKIGVEELASKIVAEMNNTASESGLVGLPSAMAMKAVSTVLGRYVVRT